MQTSISNHFLSLGADILVHKTTTHLQNELAKASQDRLEHSVTAVSKALFSFSFNTIQSMVALSLKNKCPDFLISLNAKIAEVLESQTKQLENQSDLAKQILNLLVIVTLRIAKLQISNISDQGTFIEEEISLVKESLESLQYNSEIIEELEFENYFDNLLFSSLLAFIVLKPLLAQEDSVLRQQAAYLNILSDIFETIDNQSLVKELESIKARATLRKNVDVMVTPQKKVREVVEIEIQTDTQSDKELQQGIILSQDQLFKDDDSCNRVLSFHKVIGKRAQSRQLDFLALKEMDPGSQDIQTPSQTLVDSQTQSVQQPSLERGNSLQFTVPKSMPNKRDSKGERKVHSQSIVHIKAIGGKSMFKCSKNKENRNVINHEVKRQSSQISNLFRSRYQAMLQENDDQQ